MAGSSLAHTSFILPFVPPLFPYFHSFLYHPFLVIHQYLLFLSQNILSSFPFETTVIFESFIFPFTAFPSSLCKQSQCISLHLGFCIHIPSPPVLTLKHFQNKCLSVVSEGPIHQTLFSHLAFLLSFLTSLLCVSGSVGTVICHFLCVYIFMCGIKPEYNFDNISMAPAYDFYLANPALYFLLLLFSLCSSPFK